MSERSASPSDSQDNANLPAANGVKRKLTAAGIDGNGVQRSVKRRASKACQCCRARKVRCNVTEHGAPCTNCRLDEVECIVSESRRKKKWPIEKELNQASSPPKPVQTTINPQNRKIAARESLDRTVERRQSHDSEPRNGEHVPHAIYQSHSQQQFGLNGLNRRVSVSSTCAPTYPLLGYSPVSPDPRQAYLNLVPKPGSTVSLPPFIKPLPSRIGAEEVAYLHMKGALTLPNVHLRNELLRAYIEYVHPYMPLLDLNDFLMKIDAIDLTRDLVSLILFQAVMFAGSAFVDMQDLHMAGYMTRKEARKDFFTRTRLLYDFDYESDRLALVQALLLLTYYYETPDDQKDTWHWMGVATSVAHTIGLHRNPEVAGMGPKKAKLWKRIWWSTYMRDRLIALGMRRPTRIKAEDYDVPMLTMDDFDIAPLPDSVTCVSPKCVIARDTEMQRQLAVMCIEKAKLCLCISHVLSKQYCVLNNQQGSTNDRTTMMLLPKKLDPNRCEVKACDDELQKWVQELPQDAQYTEASCGNAPLDLHRALLQMVFYTTLSALHRPQVLPSAPTAAPTSAVRAELLEISRRNVRKAASAITSIAVNLDSLGLVRYLPTTGVTVLLPAIIIHLLDIKAPDEETRRKSLRGFFQCMQVMGKLRDLYAAADYSVAFLEAAIRKAGIQVPPCLNKAPVPIARPATASTSVKDLVDAGRRVDMPSTTLTLDLLNKHIAARNALTPPPESRTLNPSSIEKNDAIMIPTNADSLDHPHLSAIPTAPAAPSDEEVARRLESFLASTPPDSDQQSDRSSNGADVATSNSKDGESNSVNPFKATATEDMFPYSNADGASTNAIVGTDLLFSNFPTEFDEGDFDNLLNMDAVGGESGANFGLDDLNFGSVGESSGFSADVDWAKVLA